MLEWHYESGVELELDQPSGYTFLLEADQATRSTYLWAFISCVHSTSVCQPHPVIRRPIDSLTLLSVFLLELTLSISRAPLRVHVS